MRASFMHVMVPIVNILDIHLYYHFYIFFDPSPICENGLYNPDYNFLVYINEKIDITLAFT